ncbi:hypothetical protein C8Q80DRAFT_1226442 [Daedaleopsis nitida]|nr:hypothetical protein C8Q80DRAFT_1226442 [Daedaleopsis nitida]
MVLSNDLSALVGFGCEAVCWRTYLVLFLASVILLLRRARTNIPVFIANFVLFVSCTAHFAIEFNHFYTTLGGTGVEGFANETPQLIGADILISLSDFVGDLILVYRCWVIWNKSFWVVFLPLLTATAGFACILVVAHFVLMLSPSSPVPPAAIVPLGTAGYVLPLATNIMTTALIVAKLWLTAYNAQRRIGDRLPGAVHAAQRAVAIIVESGLLYLVTQLVFVVLFALGHPAQAIVAVVAVQIYGIAPTLIVIRVALGISSEHTAPCRGSSERSSDTIRAAEPPTFLPALHSRTGMTEDSGFTLRPGLRADGEYLEMKSFSDLDLDEQHVAVAV